MFKNQTKYEILLLNPLDVDHIWWLLGTSCPPKKISIEKTSNQMHQMINGGKDSHHAFPPRDGDINHHETPIRIWNSQIPWEWLICITTTTGFPSHDNTAKGHRSTQLGHRSTRHRGHDQQLQDLIRGIILKLSDITKYLWLNELSHIYGRLISHIITWYIYI